MVHTSIHWNGNLYWIACTWVILAAFPVLCSRRDSYTFPVKNDIEDYWHSIGWTLRAIFAFYTCPLEFLIAYGFYFWIVFDSLYNLWTNRNVWFIGTTAGTDILIKWVGGHWIKFVGFGGAIWFGFKIEAIKKALIQGLYFIF